MKDKCGCSCTDLLVIGGGSAGFAAAIKAHELGARVIMVNSGTIGGTCVNFGCVPSKTLLRAAQAHYRAAHHGFDGIEGTSRITDFGAIVRQKDELVAFLRKKKYVDVLEAYPNIQLIEGHATFRSPNTVQVNGKELRASQVIVATGSSPFIPPIAGLREAEPLTSTSAFELTELPESLLILGGRYIAVECGQMLSRLGVRVTVLQRSDHLLPQEDEDLTEALAEYLRQEDIEVFTSVRIESVKREKGHVTVEALVGDRRHTFRAEQILCATGRRPNTGGMGLEKVGVRLGEDGRIVANDYLQASVGGIYGAGDVIGPPCYVYSAAYEGQLAAENALHGNKKELDYTALPWVIFTDPQLSGVGLNEKEARRAGLEVEVARLDLAEVPRAFAARDTRGFIKLIKLRNEDRLVGARVLAPEGGELIMEAALAIRHQIGVSELAKAFHPYLTLAEGIKLCAQSFEKDIRKFSCCSG